MRLIDLFRYWVRRLKIVRLEDKVIIGEWLQRQLCKITENEEISNKTNFKKNRKNEINEKMIFEQIGLSLSDIHQRDLLQKKHIAVLKEQVRRLEVKLRGHE